MTRGGDVAGTGPASGGPGASSAQGAASGPLRYQEDPPNVAVAYVGFAVAIILGVGAEAIVIAAFLTPRQVTAEDYLGFAFFQWAPLLLWLMVGLGALARTRPWWGREIRGSVYTDRRSFFTRVRCDLATVKRAWISAGTNDQGAHYRLAVRPPDGSARPSIRLPVYAARPLACTGKGRQLVLALADALAENPAAEEVAQAIADLRFLAEASGQDACQWLSTRRRPGRSLPASQRPS